MTRAGATICWGVVLAIGCWLPHGLRAGTIEGTQRPSASTPAQEPPTPAAPAPTRPRPSAPSPAPPRPPYERSWIQSLAQGSPRQLALTSTHVIVSSPETPIEARTLTDGTAAWTADVRTAAAPIVVDDMVMAATPGAIVALEAASGHPRWSVPVPDVAVLAASSSVIVASQPRGVQALRPVDGTRLWAATTDGDDVPVMGVGPRSVVAFAGQALSAFDLTTGKTLWRVPFELTASEITVTPTLVFLTAVEGYVCALRMEGGGLEWCFPVRVRPIGAPMTDGPRVYVAFLDAVIRVFDGHNGARRKSLKATSRPIDGPRSAGPLLAVPLVTSEFVVFNSSEDFTMTRVPGFAPEETPPTMQAAAVAGDGSVLAMIMTSPARTSLVCLRKTATAPVKAEPPPPSPPQVTGAPPAP